MKIVERTLDLFESYARLRSPASLSELAETLAIPVSSCLDLVRTIESRGYLFALKPRGPYYPTRRMLNVARAIAEYDPLAARLEPVMRALRDETSETVVLGKRRGDRVVYVDVTESERSVRYAAQIGDTRALHANSIGKALLSQMSEKDRAATLERAGLAPLTEATLVTPSALDADLERSAERGWFQNIAESSADVSAVACTLLFGGEPYGLSIVGPRERMVPLLAQHSAALLRARRSIMTGD